jgi:hypothetical protein
MLTHQEAFEMSFSGSTSTRTSRDGSSTSIREVGRSSAEWLTRQGYVWAAWTIFNPKGPTLCCLGGSKASTDPNANSHEIFFRWMHMLGGKSYVLGHVDENDPDAKKQFANVMLDAFQTTTLPGAQDMAIVSAVPSCISLGQTPTEQRLFIRDLFKHAPVIRQADWGRERYYLLKYKLDLFSRAGEEAREAYEKALEQPENRSGPGADFLALWKCRHEQIPSFVNWRPNAYESRCYEEHEFDEWWEAITSPPYLGAALPQFAHAWVGGAHASGANIPIKERFEDARDFMSHMNHPLWSAEYTTENIIQSIDP